MYGKTVETPRVVNCAIYSTLTRFTKFWVLNLHITNTQYEAVLSCTYVFFNGGYPVTLLPPPRRLVPSLDLGNTWARQLGLTVVFIPPLPPNVTEQPSKATETPSVEKHAHTPRVVNFTKVRV